MEQDQQQAHQQAKATEMQEPSAHTMYAAETSTKRHEKQISVRQTSRERRENTAQQRNRLKEYSREASATNANPEYE
jgi:hypothetical protein